MAWQLVLRLAADDTRPLFLQIAHAIASDIQRGRLRAGEPLPSTRALAAQLATHRKTVTAAYRELASQGFIAIAPARGARVIGDVPPLVTRRPDRGFAQRAGFDLPDAPARPSTAGRAPGLLLLLGGVPELRFVPHRELARAYRAALAAPRGTRLLDYGDPRGDSLLRETLATMLRQTRAVQATAETLAVVRGSQQGLYLAARALLRPGDRVAVEALGYPPAWGSFRAAGLELEPIPIDRDGLDVGALEVACERRAIHAIYVTPHHHIPTTVTLAAARRIRLLELARRRRIPILEDDHDHEFQYDGQPVLPLASADHDGVVVYLGTLSKILAPGLRLGYVAATADVIQRIAAYRVLVDQQGDHVLERAIASLLDDGTLERHVRRARRAYRLRRDALAEALHRDLPHVTFEPPRGGLSIWARAHGIDVASWVTRAHAAGVAFQDGARFALAGDASDRARLGFAACNERELAEAVRRMAATLHRRPRTT